MTFRPDPLAPYRLVSHGGARAVSFSTRDSAIEFCQRMRSSGVAATIEDRHGAQVYPEPTPPGAPAPRESGRERRAGA